MGFLQVLLLLFFGGGFIYLAYRAFTAGNINAGANWLQGPYIVNRSNDPGKFYFFLLVYLLFGIFCLTYAILILFGVAAPLPLR